MTTSTAPPRPVSTPVTRLAQRLPGNTVADADDIIAEIEALGVSDRTARERYGMPSVFALGDAVLTHLQHGRAARAHPEVTHPPARRRYLMTPLLRCGLYLGPLGVTAAATGPLHRVAWPVPALTLLLGWSAAQALTCVGGGLVGRAGVTVAARVVAGGFAAAAGLWCAFVWVAPAVLLGPDRLLAALVGLAGLTCLGTVAGALVTRAEVSVIRWSLPVWLLAAVTVADAWPAGTPAPLLLAVAVAAAAVRAYRPALTRTAPPRPALGSGEVRRALCYLAVGAAQTGCVVLLWRTGPPAVTPPALLPLLAAVPMLEALVAWHAEQLDAGLDATETGAGYARHVRGVALVTVSGLLPPLAVGVALAIAAYRLPYGLSSQLGARDLVLSLAGGALLGGVFAATLLLAGGGRLGRAAALSAAPLLSTGAVVALHGGADLLPTVVAVLAATQFVGLLAVARTTLEHRRPS